LTEKLIDYAITQGPWAIFLIALALGTWRLASFLGPYIKTFFEGHQATMTTMQDVGRRLAGQQEQQTALMSENVSRLATHTEILNRHSQRFDEHSLKLDAHGQRVDQIHRIISRYKPEDEPADASKPANKETP
jgi:hypothetical protein